jgi:hypothetical protein
MATPHDVFALHLENVGEVGAYRDLKVKANRFLAVVGDVDVFVQTTIYLTANFQAQRTSFDRAVFGRAVAIRKIRAV